MLTREMKATADGKTKNRKKSAANVRTALPSRSVLVDETKRATALRTALTTLERERRRALASKTAKTRAQHEARAARAFVTAVALKHMPKTVPAGKPPRTNGKPRPPRTRTPTSYLFDGPLDLPLGVEVDTLVGNRIQNAFEKAGLWRYEYLLDQARKIAKDASAYESQILTVLQLAVTKGVAAQELLGPVLVEATSRLQGIEGSVESLAQTPELLQLLQDAAKQATQYLLLELILLWFVEHDVVEFWIGLFQALVNDVAGFDTDLGRTRAYITSAFGDPALQELVAAIGTLRADLDARVDDLLRPLDETVSGIVNATSGAMAGLFGAFDLPLTAAAPVVPGAPDRLNVNPLDALEADVVNAVAAVRTQLHDLVDQLLQAGQIESLFVDVMIGLVVVPILAVLAVGLATGPIGAAALAAVVLIAGEELVHLVISWLAGPLQGQLAKIRKAALAALDPIKGVIAQASTSIAVQDPSALIEVLTSQLRELKDLLPEAFLEDLTQLLELARDAVLDSATDLALAAEQALGLENATAFDILQPGYHSQLTPTPQLPGGSNDHRFASTQLLADLERLNRARTNMRDSRETELTHRVSLRQVLGDANFASLLASGEAVVPLLADADLADKFPGLYRILIKEIKPSVVLQLPTTVTTAVPLAVPLAITHLGRNATRVRRDANPAAPPIEPRSLPVSRDVANSLKAAWDEAVKNTVRILVADAKLWRKYDDRNPPEAALISLPSATTYGWDSNNPHLKKTALNRVMPLGLVIDSWRAASRAIDGVCAAVSLDASDIHDRVNAAMAPLATAHANDPGIDVFILPETVDGWDGTWHGTTFTFDSLLATVPTLQALVLEILAALDGAAQPSADVTLQAAAQESQRELAKWAGARFEDDPSQAIGALGFTRLVRDAAPETTCFSLTSTPDIAFLAAPPTSADGVQPTAATLLRYRPFENRGYDGLLRISLSAVANGVRTGRIPGQGAPLATDLGWLAGNLTSTGVIVADLLIDVVVRACYDDDLAATQQAARTTDPVPVPRITGQGGLRQRVLVSLRDVVTSGHAPSTRGTTPWTVTSLQQILPTGQTLGPTPLSLGGNSALHIALSQLNLPLGAAIPPALIRVVGVGAAVIPTMAAAQQPMNAGLIDLVPAATLDNLLPVGGQRPGRTSLAALGQPNIVMCALRREQPEEQIGPTLDTLLGTSDRAGLIDVDLSGPAPQNIYDVLFAVTVEASLDAALTRTLGGTSTAPLATLMQPSTGAPGVALQILGANLTQTAITTRVVFVPSTTTWSGTGTPPAGSVTVTPTSAASDRLLLQATGVTAAVSYAVWVVVGTQSALVPTPFVCTAAPAPALTSLAMSGSQLVASGTGPLGPVTSVDLVGPVSITLLPTQFSYIPTADPWMLTTNALSVPSGMYTVTLHGSVNLTGVVAITATATPPSPSGFNPVLGASTADVVIAGTALGVVDAVILTNTLTSVPTTLAVRTATSTTVTTIGGVPAGSYHGTVHVPDGRTFAVPGTYTST